VNKYAYTPFGIIANQQETINQPFKFVGQHGVMTEPNGLYYMRARYYDPEVGRFISEDPLGVEGGDVNLYVYVGNNPLLLIDPWGLFQDEHPLVIWGKYGPTHSEFMREREVPKELTEVLLKTGEFVGTVYGTIEGAEIPTVLKEIIDLALSPEELEASPLEPYGQLNNFSPSIPTWGYSSVK